MEKIYKKADEEHVATFIVYGSPSYELFADSALSEHLDVEEVLRAYLNNCLIIAVGANCMVRPVGYNVEDDSPIYMTMSVDGSSALWRVASNDPGDDSGDDSGDGGGK